MTTTITGSWADPISGTVTQLTSTPTVMDGYGSSITARTIVHDVIGSAVPDVTILPGSLRTGTLKLVFADENDARLCEQLHAYTTGPLVLNSDERSTYAMTYVVVGTVERDLDDDSRAAWVVQVGFQEVAPS